MYLFNLSRLLVLALAFSCLQPVQAELISAPDLAARDVYLTPILKRIATNWEPIEFGTVRHGSNDYDKLSPLPQIEFCVAKDGTVGGVTVTRSTGIKAIDLAAEDAILSCSPLPVLPKVLWQSGPFNVSIDFADLDRDFVQCQKVPSKEHLSCTTFLTADGWTEPVLSIYAIPVDVLQRYPGLLKPEQIHCGENLRELSINKSEKQLLLIRESWTKFFSTHMSPTVSEILDERRRIDLTYDCLSGGLLGSGRVRSMYGENGPTGEKTRQ